MIWDIILRGIRFVVVGNILRPPSMVTKPTTFSNRKKEGCCSMRIRTSSWYICPRWLSSFKPFFLPRVEKGWQGNPAVSKSKLLFVKLLFVLEDGKSEETMSRMSPSMSSGQSQSPLTMAVSSSDHYGSAAYKRHRPLHPFRKPAHKIRPAARGPAGIPQPPQRARQM